MDASSTPTPSSPLNTPRKSRHSLRAPPPLASVSSTSPSAAPTSSPSSSTSPEGNCAIDLLHPPYRLDLATPRPLCAGAQLRSARHLFQHLCRHLRRPSRLHAPHPRPRRRP